MTTRAAGTGIVIAVGAALVAAVILAGLPVKYYGGFLIGIFLLSLFVMKPLYFMVLLFFVRALIDGFLVSIRFSAGSYDIGLGGLFSAFMIVGTLLYAVSQAKELSRLGHGVIVFYSLFCLMSVASAVVSIDRTEAAKELISRFSVLAIMVMAVLSVRSEKDAMLVFRTITVSAFIPVVVGAVRIALHQTERLEGSFAHANVMAFYLLVVIGCLVFELYREGQPKAWSLWAKFYFLLLMGGLVLTLTRSAWAAFVCMSGVYVLFFKRRWIVPMFMLMLFFAVVPAVRDRITSLFTTSGGGLLHVSESSSLAWRFNTWHRLWMEAVKAPLFGHGINASSYVGSYHKEAHNDYLRFFLESGVVGVILYFGSYLCPFLHALRRFRFYPESGLLKKISVFLLCFMPAFLLMSVSENLARYVAVQFYLMSVVGVYAALYRLEQEEHALHGA